MAEGLIMDQHPSESPAKISDKSVTVKKSKLRLPSPRIQTTPSTKSDSEHKPPLRKFRRDRTLKRNPTFREFSDDDIKYLWLLHRTSHPKPLLPDEFKQQFINEALPNYNCGWVLESVYKNEKRPMGIFFGKSFGPFVMLADMFWMPWASSRNKAECAIKFLHDSRKKFLMVITSSKKDSTFYDYISKHGVIRRVGIIQGLIEGEDATFYQTRPL